jgi:heat shock protein HspQ
MVHLLHHVLKPASDSPTLDHFRRNQWTNSPEYAINEEMEKHVPRIVQALHSAAVYPLIREKGQKELQSYIEDLMELSP